MSWRRTPAGRAGERGADLNTDVPSPRRSWRGYDRTAVDLLLRDVSTRLEQLAGERERLEAEILALRQAEQHHVELESALRDTLLTAHRAADEARERARVEAEDILRQAREQASLLRYEADEYRQRADSEVARLRAIEWHVRDRCRAMLREALERLDSEEGQQLPDDLLSDSFTSVEAVARMRTRSTAVVS